MDYGGILSKSWEITWKNKGLWVLGLLAGCTGGSGNPSQTSSLQMSRTTELPWVEQSLRNVPEETWILVAIGLVIFALVIAAVFIVLGLLGQAGLIAGVARADDTGSVRLAEAWAGGLPHFWRLLGFTLLIIAVVLIVALAAGIFAAVTMGFGMICLAFLICLLLPLGIVISAYLSLTQNGIVLENLGVFRALERAWQITRDNFWPVVAMALILAVIGLLAGIVFAIPFFLLAIPTLAFFFRDTSNLASLVPMLACVVVYVPLSILLSAVLRTFTSSVWTLTFRRLTGIGPMAVAVPEPG